VRDAAAFVVQGFDEQLIHGGGAVAVKTQRRKVQPAGLR
jgi:hypothetical protein